MNAGITDHAARRYVQRVRPDLTAAQARLHLLRLVRKADLADVLIDGEGSFLEIEAGVRLRLIRSRSGRRVATVVVTDMRQRFTAARARVAA